MIKYLILIMCISSCSILSKSQKKLATNSLKCSIVDIKEYESSYCLTALDSFGNKVIIVSLKKNPHKITLESLDTISLHKNYDFNVTRIKPRVSTMEQLGSFIIIERDTLWKASTSDNIPPAYIAHNTIGLICCSKED